MKIKISKCLFYSINRRGVCKKMDVIKLPVKMKSFATICPGEAR